MRHTSMTLPLSRTRIAHSIIIAVCVMIPFCVVNAQIDGDNIFSVDQIISIDLAFPQDDFWGDLQTHYAADENEYIPAMLTLTDVSGTHVMDSVGVRLKGNSSYSHPGVKKSFKIDFNKYISGQNYDGLKKLNFGNGFKDPTCMREKLFFDVCREAGVLAPRASFANVTFNGEAWGFYTVVEQIDDQFLDWAIEEDSGNLFKAGDNFGGGGPGGGGGENNTAADLADYGTDPAVYADRYELKTNEDVNDWSDLISLIDFINNTDLNAFGAGIDFRMDVDGFLRSAALDMLFSNLDSYTGSARNYYIYHNQESNLWEWIKWDGNEAFGSYTNSAGDMETLAIDYANPTRPLLERMFDYDELYSRYLDHVCELTETLFNETHLHERIDVVTELIASSVYADDNKMYSNADFEANLASNLSSGGGGPMGGTTYGLKSFVTNRSAHVTSQLECQTVSDVESLASSLRTFPNPAQNEVIIEGLPQGSNVSLVNASGQVVFEALANDQHLLRIDVAALAEGMYILSSSNGWAERLLIVR